MSTVVPTALRNSDFEYQGSRIDNVLLRMQRRGENFFDNKIRLTNLFEIVSQATVSLISP